MSIKTPQRPSAQRPDPDSRPSAITARSLLLQDGFEQGDFRRRLRWLLVGIVAVLALFSLRLVYLQTIKAGSLAEEAVATRTAKVTIPAPRGSIYDSEGIALAQTVAARNVTADQTIVGDPNVAAAQLAPLLGQSQQELAQTLTGTKRFVYVAKQVPPETWDKVRALNLPGILSESTTKRVYPNGNLAGNVIGFVGGEGRGLSGLEYGLDKELAGTDGYKRYEVGGNGRAIPTGHSQEVSAIPGVGVRLTINRDIQWVAQQAIARKVKEVRADSGTVVVMEPRTGRILALASVPTVDPNRPDGSPKADLGNRATTEAFEPGSTSKVMTVAAVLDQKKAKAETVFTVPDSIPRGGFIFNDHDVHPTWQLTLAGILAKSSNTGTIQAAELIGKDKLFDYIRKFGVGQSTGLNFPGESTGFIPKVKDWSATSFPTISFGQGLSLNAIQAASVFATIGNDGVRMQPKLVDSYVGLDGTVQQTPQSKARRVVSPEAARSTREMMEEVVGKEGTAPMAAIPGFRVAGKTGTAFRIDDSCGCYRGYTASFIGLAPADDPRAVVAVILQNPRAEHYGGLTGGPVFKEVMTSTLQTLGVAPSGSRAPNLPIYASDAKN